MIERLVISDLALVDRVEVEFGPGLNAVTGETGAGKSLLVQSVNLLVGERADADQVRDGARSAIVEGEFRLAPGPARRVAELLSEWGLEFDGETVIVRREVQAGGKSRAAVNQSPVTLAALKRLGEILADLHGQHEHQSLLRPDAGIEVLDRLGRLENERDRYAATLGAWRAEGADLERLEQTLASHADRREWMLEAARELDGAHLVGGEEEELRREAGRLAHADRLRELVAQALEALSEGERSALDAIGAAAHAIDQAAALDPGLTDTLPVLEEARIAAGETARALTAYASKLESDPQALEAVEARRELIARLTRKYRRGVPELLRWREDLRSELATGEDAAGALARARQRLARAEQECHAAGQALSKSRQAAAREWSTRLTREFKPLGLSHARLEFVVEPPAPGEARFLSHGLDQVEMRFTANPGEPPRPLQRIVSGGELSRVMLALKASLESQDRVDVLVFDEVDSGIGGAVAQAVGERLRRLARHRQIVCVTHLPMIAALASHHLRVTKHVVAGRTVVRIAPLDAEARVDELARMLAGDLATSTTRRQARELLGASVLGPSAR
jgi:DNA repair protein RecN (Recombination protein N)